MTKKKTPHKPLTRGQDAIMLRRGYLSVPAVARQCGVTRATVESWMTGGHVGYTRVGLRLYVQRGSLAVFLGPEGAKMLEAAT
jgi:hypothetical protein